LRKTFAEERKAYDTDEQFIYRTRKKAFGPFKRKFWQLPATSAGGLGRPGKQIRLSVWKLNVQKTSELVRKKVKPCRSSLRCTALTEPWQRLPHQARALNGSPVADGAKYDREITRRRIGWDLRPANSQ